MDAVNYISDVLQKTKGKELKVAFLGGSLSKGERVKRELCFVSLFEQKIEEKLSNGRKVSVLRYGQSGTMSSNGLYKVKELIEEKPDLVFLDYAMNDTGDRYLWESTEGICSQLIQAGFCFAMTRGIVQGEQWKEWLLIIIYRLLILGKLLRTRFKKEN